MNNIYAIDWKIVLLRENPFPNTPPTRPEDSVWAGFPDLKRQLDTLFAEAISTPRTQVALNRGEYGSGKTHAAVFCRRQDYLRSFHDGKGVQEAIPIYITTPKEPDKADITLYQNIIETIQFRRIRLTVRDIIIKYGVENALQKLQGLIGSESLGKALWLLGHEQERRGQLVLFQDDNAADEYQQVIERFFFSQTTLRDLKQLGLSRNINNIQDRFRVLSCILQCMIGLDEMEDIKSHRRVILWLDELEDLIGYPTRYYRPFTQGLRDLIDHLPFYFTLMMNFTLATPESMEDIGVVLGKALMDRITTQIYFSEPTKEEAVDYVTSLLKQYRIESSDVKVPATYPFDKEALDILIANLAVRTPRHINQTCANIIGKALQSGIIHSPGKDIITKEFIRKVEDERIEFEVR
jgi:hypothetical protein